MKNILVAFFTILLTVGFVGEGLSHPPDEPAFKKEAIREKVKIMYVWELTRALNLDEETAARLFPIMHKYDKEKTEIQKSIRKDVMELREALDYKAEAQISDILKRLKKKRERMHQLEDKKISELKNILTLEQQAKLVLFQRKFSRDVRKMLAEARRHRAGIDRPEPVF